MFQHLQACNLRIKMLRLEDPGYMSYSECLFVTCLGILMVTLGILVIVYSFSDSMALCIGILLMAVGCFFIVLTGTLVLCTAGQNLQSTVRQKLEEEERGRRSPDWTEPSVTASTFL